MQHRSFTAAGVALSLFLSSTAGAATPTAQQKIDRITWSFETIAHSISISRKAGGWTLLSAAAGSAAVSIAHWVDYSSIPSTDSTSRNRAASWGAASAATGLMFAIIGSTALLFPNSHEKWKEDVAKIPGLTAEERLSGYETHFQNRVSAEKSGRITGSLVLAISGVSLVVLGFFPSDPFYRGALWFVGGIYAGMSVPGFILKGFYEREWEAYQSWISGGEPLTIASHSKRKAGVSWNLEVMPSPDGLGAGASLRF
jgi:hypothetical protein